MHVTSRREVAHRGFKRSMSHPVLNRPHIEAGPQHPRRIGRAEGLQIKFPLIKLCPFRDRLAAQQQILFAITLGRWEYEPAIALPGMRSKQFDERLRDRDFPLFPALRPEPKIRLRRDPNRVEREIQIRPTKMHYFLLAESREEKRRE